MPDSQNNNGQEYYKLWLEKAAEDELSLQAVLKDGAPSTACFLAQQMSEKLLKALLVFQGMEFAKVHDLLNLMTMLQNNTPDILTIQDDLARLNDFYTEARYADDYHVFSKEEATDASARAMNVKQFILSKISH